MAERCILRLFVSRLHTFCRNSGFNCSSNLNKIRYPRHPQVHSPHYQHICSKFLAAPSVLRRFCSSGRKDLSNEESQLSDNTDVYDEYYEIDFSTDDFLSVDKKKADMDDFIAKCPVDMRLGKTGVFDVDDVVCILASKKALNITVTPIPKEANYVDHFVIFSAMSQRHLRATCEYVRRVFKVRYFSYQQEAKSRFNSVWLPHLEERKNTSWLAMDMGNMVLHGFMPETREYYDLESLWTLGPEADPKCTELPQLDLSSRIDWDEIASQLEEAKKNRH